MALKENKNKKEVDPSILTPEYFSDVDYFLNIILAKNLDGAGRAISAILALMRGNLIPNQRNEEMANKYYKVLTIIFEKLREERSKNIDYNNLPEWKDIYETVSRIPILKDKVLLSLFTLFPPRRCEDYANMWVSSEPNDLTKNYYTGEKFIFNDYKTAFTYRQQSFLVPEDLKDLLSEYLCTWPYTKLFPFVKKQFFCLVFFFISKIFWKKFNDYNV